MTRAVVSASRLPLISKCIGAAVLPTIDSESEQGSVGSAKHEHLQMRATHGLDAAIDALDPIAERWGLDEHEAGIMAAQMRAFRWMPPKGARAEVSLCLRADGSVVRVSGGRGRYADLPEDAVLPGQIDLMWAEPGDLEVEKTGGDRARLPEGSTLFVTDYKTGDEANVTSIDRNEQLWALGLLGQRWTGAKQVVIGTIFPRAGDGEWDVTPPISAATFGRVEAKLKRRLALIEEQRARYAAGAPLDLVEGPHCTYCPAQARCPAKTAMLKAVTGDLAPPFGDAPLTADQAQWIAVRLPQVSGFVRRAREALEAHVALNGPIALPDGNVWGPIEEEVEVISAGAARPVLDEELGEHANVVVKVSVSKSAIEDAIADKHAQEGIRRQKAPAMRRVLKKLHDAGAITKAKKRAYRAHRPKAAELMARSIAALPATGTDSHPGDSQ